MIGWLNGKIVDAAEPGKLVLDVHGVGYDVETSLSTYFQVEQETLPISLFIHTVVREDAFLLYGFLHKEERALFRSLIKVNGVGPKLAIAVLSSMPVHDFIRCIQQEQVSLLTKIPGVGKKTAERLVVEMKDSLRQGLKEFPTPASSLSNESNMSNSGFAIQQEAISALEALGYKAQEAARTIQAIDDGQKSAENLIREALKKLAVYS